MAKKRKIESPIQVNLRHVKLTKESRKSLRKVKESIWGNVADAIECGDWWIPVKNHKYSHMVSEFESGMYDFYGLDPKKHVVEVKSIETGIIEYD